MVRAGNWQLLGINAQLLDSGTEQELALWRWIDDQARSRASASGHTALFLHRPAWRPASGELQLKGRYIPNQAAERLPLGTLRTLRLVISGHTHQYLDLTVEEVRHVWLPSTAFVLPDDIQASVGEKLVGIASLDLEDDGARLDLWCPDGMSRHDITMLPFVRAMTGDAAGAGAV